MDGRFARSLARLHRVGSTRLADSIGCYQEGGAIVAKDLPLQIDQEYGELGAGEAFAAGVLFISWLKCRLSTADAGGVFVVGSDRYLVEKVLADDGHMVTAACMGGR